MDAATLNDGRRPIDAARIRAVSRLLLSAAAFAAIASACLWPASGQADDSIALGVNIAKVPGHVAPLRRYVKLTGRPPALVMWYQQWSEPLFYPGQLPHVSSVGALPVITWDPELDGSGISMQDIVAGRYDAYIRAAARAAARWKHPIYIRFAHEMNLAGSAFGPGHPGNSPLEFVRAWRHVVRIFRGKKATNVEWIWSPNANCDGKCPFKPYYPGNRWVDWVALDGYNYSIVDHVPWMSFASIFGSSYRTLTRISDKPVMIGETSSAPHGGSKAEWITHSFDTIPRRFPRIRAVVWFDRVKGTNWTVNSSPASLRAWRRVVHSPKYEGSASTLLHVAPFGGDVAFGSVSEPARRYPRDAASRLADRFRPFRIMSGWALPAHRESANPRSAVDPRDDIRGRSS